MIAGLLPFAAIGLLGSLHCAGMCGGFAVVAGNLSSGKGRASALGHELVYIVGKALTYGLLGLLAHLGFFALARNVAAAQELEAASISVANARMIAAWLAGSALILIGLGHLGLRLPRIVRAPRLAARWRSIIGGAWSGVRSLPGATGSFTVGLVTGLLPCGLSWSAILLAATSSHGTAFLGPFLFGFATAPALLLTASAGRVVRRRVGAWSLRLVGPALILLGVLTLARGAVPGAQALAPDCCSAIGSE